MGKIRHRKKNKKSCAPISNQVTGSNNHKNGDHVEEEEEDFSKIVSDIIEKLETPSMMEKLSALLLLSDMVDLKQIRLIIIEYEVCKIVAPLLLDNDLQVCVNAAVAIRNLSACGEEEICDAMVEQDVLTPVLTLFGNISQNLIKVEDCSMDVDNTKSKAKKSSEWEEKIDLTCQALNILRNLCESCTKVLKYVNNDQVLNILVDFMQPKKYHINLSIAAGEFIHMLSEDNNIAIKFLNSNQQLFRTNIGELNLEISNNDNDMNGTAALLQVLCAGILQNLNQDFLIKEPNQFEYISKILSINQRNLANKLTSELPKSNEKIGQDQISNITNLISAQKLILEYITNLCSMDDDSESVEDMDIDEEDEEEGGESIENSLKLPSEVPTLFNQYNTLNLVFEKSDLPPVNVCEIMRSEDDYKHIFRKLVKLQCTAFLCINNLVSGIMLPDEKLFDNFLTILKQYADNQDGEEEQEESLTCALRSIIIKLNDNQFKLPINNISNQINLIKQFELETEHSGKMLIENYPIVSLETICTISKFLWYKLILNTEKQEGKYLKVAENLVKIISTWTCVIYRLKIQDSTLEKIILTKLISFLQNQTDLMLLSETLDSLIDLFSDDDTDDLAKQLQLIHNLTLNEPKLKTMLKAQKKTLDKEKLALVSTVQTNLHAFIQYKRNRIQKLK